MKKFKIAGILMILHGGIMELATVLILGPLMITGKICSDNPYFTFGLNYLQENLTLMLGMAIIFGLTRVIGAIGLMKNRMWGFVLSIINCVVTMAVMMFMLPAGIMDGILACTALILMLTQYFGKKKIIE